MLNDDVCMYDVCTALFLFYTLTMMVVVVGLGVPPLSVDLERLAHHVLVRFLIQNILVPQLVQ